MAVLYRPMKTPMLLRCTAIAMALYLSGCHANRELRMETSVQAARRKALAAVDESACRAKGGHVGSFGMFGLPTCVRPLPDAGKACTGHTDCEGRCLNAGPPLPPGTEASGICQREEPLGGCWQEVTGGRAMQGWCAE